MSRQGTALKLTYNSRHEGTGLLARGVFIGILFFGFSSFWGGVISQELPVIDKSRKETDRWNVFVANAGRKKRRQVGILDTLPKTLHHAGEK